MNYFYNEKIVLYLYLIFIVRLSCNCFDIGYLVYELRFFSSSNLILLAYFSIKNTSTKQLSEKLVEKNKESSGYKLKEKEIGQAFILPMDSFLLVQIIKNLEVLI